MTLAECIARHEAATASPIRRPAAVGALTDKGVATVTAIRLRRQLAALDPAERREIIAALSVA